MQLLVSDTNIPIDIKHGDLILAMFSLKIHFIVPNILFERELEARHSDLLDLGLKIKVLSDAAVDKVTEFSAKYRQPSRIDIFALSLAWQESCPLLTGDKNLRKAADQEGIQVHGTIWLIGEMLREKIIQPMIAQTAFQRMKSAGSRLPWDEADKLISSYELVGAGQ